MATPALQLPPDTISAEDLLTWGYEEFGERFCLTCSWQKQSSVLIHMVAELGLPIDVVELDNSVSLDFADAEGPIRPQHYAFLISEADFDAVFSRIKDRGLEYWADPRGSRPGEINHSDGGRGVYFRDPDGHSLEVITRPYGSGG